MARIICGASVRRPRPRSGRRPTRRCGRSCGPRGCRSRRPSRRRADRNAITMQSMQQMQTTIDMMALITSPTVQVGPQRHHAGHDLHGGPGRTPPQGGPAAVQSMRQIQTIIDIDGPNHLAHLRKVVPKPPSPCSKYRLPFDMTALINRWSRCGWPPTRPGAGCPSCSRTPACPARAAAAGQTATLCCTPLLPSSTRFSSDGEGVSAE